MIRKKIKSEYCRARDEGHDMMMEVRGSKWLWKNNNNKVRKKRRKERE